MPLASIPSPSQGVWYLGPIPLRAYALCIVLGVIVAVWLSERRWRARGGAPGTMVDIAVPAVIFGLIGGRLYHVITDWQLYFGPDAPNKPYEALFIWNGGLGIWGAVALGGVGVWLSCRKRGLSLSAVADTVAPGIAFAQAIGRWGNYFNQELFGGPTTLPWGLEIEPGRAGTIEGYTGLYHPTFLYESLWNVALGFALIWAGRRFTLRHGRLFALYVAGYTVGRFWIEGLRVDPVGGVDHAVHFLGLRINQWTAIVLFVGALVYLWVTRNKDAEEIVVPPSAEPASGSPSGTPADGDEPAGDARTSDDGARSSDDDPASGETEPADGVASSDGVESADRAESSDTAEPPAAVDAAHRAESADDAEAADGAEDERARAVPEEKKS